MSRTHNQPSTKGIAEIGNARVRVAFDLASGTYDLHDPVAGRVVIRGAHAQVGPWTSCAPGYVRTARTEKISDELGSGTRLVVECVAEDRPSLLLEFRVYDGDDSAIALRAGLKNPSSGPLRLRRFFPMRGGRIAPGSALEDARTLSGNSACHQPEVMRSPHASSSNNLLLTFRENGGRRSVVLGALKTADFMKWAHVLPEDGFEGRARLPSRALPGARLAVHLDCRVRTESLFAEGPRLSVTQGFRNANGILSHPKEIHVALSGLDPEKHYALGFSWRDHGGSGRAGSVKISAANGAVRPLVEKRPLPGHGAGEEVAVLLPRDLCFSPRPWIQFINEFREGDIVVDEAWLWEVDPGAEIPPEWAGGRVVEDLPASASGAAFAALEAFDPAGRLVDAGAAYFPDDSFYVDFGTPHPFEALEKYGRQLRRATRANPNPYDFPTVCAWYAGVWHTKGAQDHPELSTYKINTSAGLVEEAAEIEKCGFLKYARAAGRLVPDTYAEQNPQGWWDDEHWRRDGYYTAPYETTAKFGAGMRGHGCLAFTYIQPICGWARQPVSRDFRERHPDWLCAGSMARSLDYTHPEVQRHLQEVFAAMRGHIHGLMIDYCDDHWDPEAVLGGFADPHATAAAFYRILFRLAKEGLGPESWLHERNLYFPDNDLTLGFADLQRTEADTDKISPYLVSRGGLRWYKNRVVIGYDMDSKDITGSWKIPGWNGSDEDGRRMTLTMSYVASSRLLLANSFRDLDPATLHDLTRTFPYPAEPRSARPIDAFSHTGFPRVYDFAVTPRWHQVVLYNNTIPTQTETFQVLMSGDVMDGALGLDAAREYYVFDFWNQRFAGRVKGSGRLEQTLRPGEARMLSVHEVENHPQFLSTDRHLMQGYLDFETHPAWDAESHELSGVSKVIGGEPYRVILACNGFRPLAASQDCEIGPADRDDLAVLTILKPQNETVRWVVPFASQLQSPSHRKP